MFKLLIISLLFTLVNAVYLPPPTTCENIQEIQLEILQSIKTLILDLQPILQSTEIQRVVPEKDTGGDTGGDTGNTGGDTGNTGGDNSVRNVEIQENYYDGSGCNTNGIYSTNEFGAQICQYPGTTCDLVKYFSYPGGGNGVELCCESNDDCNYDSIKNYCAPNLRTCSDGSYFGCSTKGGPIFDSCL